MKTKNHRRADAGGRWANVETGACRRKEGRVPLARVTTGHPRGILHGWARFRSFDR
jgi:hypothetical protein